LFLDNGAMPALLKAIADSMGSFYDLIAVQTMGCPPYQTLFAICS
uniref:Ornithine decarboxylase n=1 Tax=Angiostrongylus cantonensis TaxID=6313 RepID=A0A0K0DRU4_ANGCA